MALTNCTSHVIPFPSIFGAEFLSLEANLVSNVSYSSFATNNGPGFDATNLSFCNVTTTHTHPGQNDTVIAQVWLPLQSTWNGRLQAVGGGGWTPGLNPTVTLPSMYGAINSGFATVSTNGGLPSEDPEKWALLSPGNVDFLLLQNFADTAIKDGALIAKDVIASFYGRNASYSYWSGCSQGGRQGMMFAQRYPEIFDGIAAAAPAINYAQFFVSAIFAQQVMNEGQYPHPCELDALTRAAVRSCDANDGLVDGIIAAPDSCQFDPFAQVGAPSNCTTAYAPKNISRAAAVAADAAWKGARTADGTFLWWTTDISANLTGIGSAATTTCSSNGTCTGEAFTFFDQWIRLFVKKDPKFNLKSMSRQDYVDVFHASVRQYESIIGMNYPDLSQFHRLGKKLITYHGIADQIISFRGTRYYYEEVTRLSPNIHDFYRLFEAPGLSHCFGGRGGYPSGTFDALVRWVEKGIAPDHLVATSAETNVSSIICPYPQRAELRGRNAAQYGPEDFVCVS
ncbi:Tannase/feruloyl esterase [Dendryphion nanum]|uniref:Carboxylic ester hydrolase n=1 Tax=Dendryphion nanum TaxID=256645 RepID=A0A9P9DPB5_9PLEO|nr:Tannase/feruloyl esterase [Dendryphion nanum]